MKSTKQILKNALLSQESGVNHEDAWLAIDRELSKRKKKKRFIFFSFFVPFLAITVGSILSLDFTSEKTSDQIGASDKQFSSHIKTELPSNADMTESTDFTDQDPVLSKPKDGFTFAAGSQLRKVGGISPSSFQSSFTKKNLKEAVALTFAQKSTSVEKLSKGIASEKIVQVYQGNESLGIFNTPLLPVHSIVYQRDSVRYEATFPDQLVKKKRNYWPEFSFVFGMGTVPVINEYSDLSLGEIATTISRRNQFYGLELDFRINNTWSFRTGFLEHSRRYKVELLDGGYGVFFQYNYSLPLMFQYQVSRRNWSPFLAFGAHYNVWEDFRGINTSRTDATRLGYTSRVLVGSLLTPAVEFGTSFSIRNHKFSVGAEANFGLRRTFQSRYGIIEGRQILREIGEGYSNGSYYALKIKYHLDPKRWLEQSERLIGRSSALKSNEKSHKNELGIELGGAGFYGSVYYQRQLYSKENLRLVIKQGFLYVPEFEEKGFVSGPPDDIKPMGFYIPTSLLAELGPRKLSLQLGVANLFHYGPLRYPIPLGQTNALERGQFLITGVKSQIGRITLYGQFNLSFDFKSENVVATNLGFGTGYVF